MTTRLSSRLPLLRKSAVEPSHVFSVGHSTHSIAAFVELLKTHGVNAIADVRSSPFSRTSPHFSREPLRESLRSEAIAYVFLGEELGARSSDPTTIRDGRVQYELLARTKAFEDGIRRVIEGATQYRIALMCAEKEPLECHRAILVSRALVERGLAVDHIHADGRLEPHQRLVNRMLALLGVRLDSTLIAEAELIVREAYRVHGESIAYSHHVAKGSSRDDPSAARLL